MVRGRLQRRPAGFTLVELLVVIAIIGVLVALLLPAVQAAREAARRSSCSNQLKQISLALHNHHDTLNRLPPGGAADKAPLFGTSAAGSAWGTNWSVYILPYMEQQPLFDKFNLGGGSGWGTNAATNTLAAKDVLIKTYQCPSTPLDAWCRSPNSNGKIAANSYVGNSGAVDGLITNPAFAETRINTGSSGGTVSGGGVLIPNGELTLASITDGTSNTIMVGEASNWIWQVPASSGGPLRRVDWRNTAQHGWIIGFNSNNKPPSLGSGDLRTFSLTTLRYAINDTDRGNAGFDGTAAQGVMENASSNIPYNSAHPSGAMFCLADGSVRLISTSTDLQTLAQLCTRDDGQVARLD